MQIKSVRIKTETVEKSKSSKVRKVQRIINSLRCLRKFDLPDPTFHCSSTAFIRLKNVKIK